MDLENYKGMYTLLIGFYEGSDRKKAAEKAAAAIRLAGDEGFFLNGPKRSLVTVGLFTENDMPDGQFGSKIKDMQKKYPHYSANGVTIVEFEHGQRLGEKPSLLMQIE